MTLTRLLSQVWNLLVQVSNKLDADALSQAAQLSKDNELLVQITALQKSVADLAAAQPAITNLQTQVNTLTAQSAALQKALDAATANALDADSIAAIQAAADQIEVIAQANAAVSAVLPSGSGPAAS